MDIDVNMVSVLVATIVAMIVGAVWYSPQVFGKLWMKLARLDREQLRQIGSTRPIMTTLAVTFITAYVLAHITYLSHTYFKNSALQDSVTTAFWVWLGFVASRVTTHDAFEGRPAMLTILTISHELVTFIAMGLAIGLLQQ